jgi:hypothetical protein
VQAWSRWFVTFQAKRVQIDAVRMRDAATNAILAATTAKNSNGGPPSCSCPPTGRM